MTFNSVQYALFLPLVFATYWLLPHRKQNWLLLAAGYFFYGYWDWRFLGLLLFSTLIDFLVAPRIDAAASDAARRGWLLSAVSVQLAILGYFKYAGFFVDSFRAMLTRIGLDVNVPLLRVLLPVGVSFYTFQTITYTVDVYRRRMKPTRDLLDFAVFVAFFPPLVAGPIERARHLLPQVESPRSLDRRKLHSGLLLILLGLFKKVALADAMAPVADAAFATTEPGTVTTLVGAYAFAVQIYAGFSGYTDIARGSARLLGFELILNFEQPYLSRNITEFWRRWHISLSTWLRDYLYVPLGGNRGSRWMTYRNLMLTMVLGGLWHGAAAGFIVWGAIHGVLLSLHRAYTERASLAEPRTDPTWRDLPRILLTFHAVTLAWIFFRATSWSEATRMLGGLFRPGGTTLPVSSIVLVAVGIAVMVTLDILQRRRRDFESALEIPVVLRAVVYAAMVVAVLVWSGGTARPFIYFQF